MKNQNPWKETEGSNFILEGDAEIIKAFNENLGVHPHLIHLDLMPEPYIGNPKANVIFLFGNPGYGGNEMNNYNEIPGFKKAIEKNLTHSNTEYPYFYLNPAFDKADGAKWLLKRTEILRESLNIDLEELSKKIFTLQLHPYHSVEFKGTKDSFKSHKYSMELFENAVDRAQKGEALIIGARAYKQWNTEYKNLKGKDEDLKKNLSVNFVEMLHPRSLYFTPKHLGKDTKGHDNFEKLIAKLKESL